MLHIDYDDPNLYLQLEPGATMPSKRDEDGCWDLYAHFPQDELVIAPFTAALVPTGIRSAFSPKYRVAFRERGSTIKNRLIVRAGQIDSGYRGEWFMGLYNDSDTPLTISRTFFAGKPIEQQKLTVVYPSDTDRHVRVYIPYDKALCQFAVEEVPQTTIYPVSDVSVFSSERGEGKLGSSNK